MNLSVFLTEVKSGRSGRASVGLTSTNSHSNLVSIISPRQTANDIFVPNAAQLSPSVQAARLLGHVIADNSKHISRSSPAPQTITPLGRALDQTYFFPSPNQQEVNNQIKLNTGSAAQQIQNLPTQIGAKVNQNSITVGDLVRSLNGRNGIKVISLSEMQNLASLEPKNTEHHEGSMLHQLRNALISENLKVDLSREQRQLDGLFGSSNGNAERQIGVGLPDASNQNSFTLGDGSIASDDFGASSFSSGGATVNDIVNSGNDVGIPLPDFTQDLTTSSGLDVGSDDFSDTPFNTDDFLSSNYDDYDDVDLDDAPPLSLPAQPPNVFRTGVSDIFFTKGQWLGTLIGGFIDIGSAFGEGISKLFQTTVGKRDDDK